MNRKTTGSALMSLTGMFSERVTGDRVHKRVIDIPTKIGYVAFCRDCLRTWSEGAGAPEYPTSCDPFTPGGER